LSTFNVRHWRESAPCGIFTLCECSHPSRDLDVIVKSLA
jgi:hypothetical protein